MSSTFFGREHDIKHSWALVKPECGLTGSELGEMLSKFEELEYVFYFADSFPVGYMKRLENELPGVQILQTGMYD